MIATDSLRCWAEIECAALRHNAALARERLTPGAALMAVIKANGYGHGLTGVAEAVADHVQLFGVANLQEALNAREVVSHPVLIMGPALPAERAAIAEHGFIASISSYAEAVEFTRAAGEREVAVNCAIDTGMGRMGMRESDAVAEIKQIAGLQRLKIHSVSTHLPSADEEPDFTAEQLARFSRIVAAVRSEVQVRYQVHALPSAGIIAFGGSAYDIVRAGLLLYGISPIRDFQKELRPAMTLKSRVVLVRDLSAGSSVSYGRTFIAPRQIRVATLSIGYADGLHRSISNKGGTVLIRGCRCAILGRVTMDLTIVDVSDLPDVEVGDEVVVIGRQGNEEILATEVADRASTIAWEVFTGIGSRVARVYV